MLQEQNFIERREREGLCGKKMYWYEKKVCTFRKVYYYRTWLIHINETSWTIWKHQSDSYSKMRDFDHVMLLNLKAEGKKSGCRSEHKLSINFLFSSVSLMQFLFATEWTILSTRITVYNVFVFFQLAGSSLCLNPDSVCQCGIGFRFDSMRT